MKIMRGMELETGSEDSGLMNQQIPSIQGPEGREKGTKRSDGAFSFAAWFEPYHLESF